MSKSKRNFNSDSFESNNRKSKYLEEASSKRKQKNNFDYDDDISLEEIRSYSKKLK